jgi:hypothetical protein
MSGRSRFVLCAGLTALVLAAGVFGLLAYSQDALPDAGASQEMLTPQTQAAIDQGLAYLANRQAQSGAFGTNQYQGNVAITALCGLAFMSAGHQPGRGKYGPVVVKALDYVLNQEQPVDNLGRPTPGFLYHKSLFKQHGAMYEHGFGTMFLAEAYGMVYDPDLRKRLATTLKQAVQLIVNSQNTEGGWRYSPSSTDADLSVTVCQIMALRAAKNAGITVPASVKKRCEEYVKACQQPNRGGAFQYMKQGGHYSFPLTAAGVVALYSAGVYHNQAIHEGLEYLKKYKPGLIAPPDQMFQLHYFYGHYYAAQAMWIAGGSYWKEWFPAVREDLLSKRFPDGSWNDKIDPHYSTAMALIVLQMPNNYLPIFQR